MSTAELSFNKNPSSAGNAELESIPRQRRFPLPRLLLSRAFRRLRLSPLSALQLSLPYSGGQPGLRRQLQRLRLYTALRHSPQLRGGQPGLYPRLRRLCLSLRLSLQLRRLSLSLRLIGCLRI